ncbi:MAG: hypothetical protein AB8B87_27485, partial [Granulosicoccus sp.]
PLIQPFTLSDDVFSGEYGNIEGEMLRHRHSGPLAMDHSLRTTNRFIATSLPAFNSKTTVKHPRFFKANCYLPISTMKVDATVKGIENSRTDPARR